MSAHFGTTPNWFVVCLRRHGLEQRYSSSSTTNLPLSLPTQTRSTTVNSDLNFVTQYTPGTQFTQATLNEWLIRAIGELDEKGDLNATSAAVRETFQLTAPTNPVAGNVWYDTAMALSV